MSALLISLLVVAILLCVLLAFLDADHSATIEGTTPFSFSPARSNLCDNREFASLGSLIFSNRDWRFIQREQSPFLDKLYTQERRAVVTHWLLESAARLRAIRANHLQYSRLSENLNVFAEVRLFSLFFYLTFLCWSLLLLVRFSHPSTPRALALHFQSMACRLLFAAPEALVSVTADQQPPLAP